MEARSTSADELSAFLTGGGEMGALIRSHRWDATPLGHPSKWPQSLRSALSICLHSSFPTAIYWGPDLRLLYNDAWAPIPADRHPWALGRPGAEVWSDIWPVVGPQFERVLATGQGFSTFDQMLPMLRSGLRRETYWNYSFTAIRGEDGSVVGIFNQGNETTTAVLARRQAEAEIARLGRMFHQAPGAVAILRGPQHEFEFVNAAYEELVGHRQFVGRSVREALPEVISQGFVDLLDRVFARGEPHVGRSVPVMLHRAVSGPPQERLVDFVFQPLFDADGQSTGIFVQATDVTEQRRSEEARQLLLREMVHRVKNLFAITSAMVSMTARHAPSVRDMEISLRGRLQALSKAHELIRAGLEDNASPGENVSFKSLLSTIIDPQVDAAIDQLVSLDGPDFDLSVDATTSLALIFHELATNAAKYGALSNPNGHLSIKWEVADGKFGLEWVETGSPQAIGPPRTEGFGSKLARSTAAAQLGGTIAFDWRPVGVAISIAIPLFRLRAETRR